MPISGLVLTLSEKPVLQEQLLARLQTREELQLGKLVDRWLPVAVTATDEEQCRELHDWMLACSGVEQVDVIYVSFEQAGFVGEDAIVGQLDVHDVSPRQPRERQSTA